MTAKEYQDQNIYIFNSGSNAKLASHKQSGGMTPVKANFNSGTVD